MPIETTDELHESQESQTEVTESQSPSAPRLGFLRPNPDGSMGWIDSQDPNAATQYYQQRTQEYFGALQASTMRFLDAAAEYSNNPYIQRQAEGVINNISNVITGQMQAAAMAEKREAGIRRQQQHEMEMAKFGQQTELFEQQQEQMEVEKQGRIEFMNDYIQGNGGNPDEYDDNKKLQMFEAYKIKQSQLRQEWQMGDKPFIPEKVNSKNLYSWLQGSDQGQTAMADARDKAMRNFGKQEIDALAEQLYVNEMRKRDQGKEKDKRNKWVPWSELPEQSEFGANKSFYIEKSESLKGNVIDTYAEYTTMGLFINLAEPGQLRKEGQTIDDVIKKANPELYKKAKEYGFVKTQSNQPVSPDPKQSSADPEDPYGPGSEGVGVLAREAPSNTPQAPSNDRKVEVLKTVRKDLLDDLNTVGRGSEEGKRILAQLDKLESKVEELGYSIVRNPRSRKPQDRLGVIVKNSTSSSTKPAESRITKRNKKRAAKRDIKVQERQQRLAEVEELLNAL